MMIVLATVQTMKTKMILVTTSDEEDAIDANAETHTLIVIQMITTRIQKTIALMDSINSDMRIA